MSDGLETPTPSCQIFYQVSDTISKQTSHSRRGHRIHLINSFIKSVNAKKIKTDKK